MAESAGMHRSRPAPRPAATFTTLCCALLCTLGGCRAAPPAQSGAAPQRQPSASPPAVAARNPTMSAAEMDYYREKYGPDHFSEREEEWFIRDFFADRRGGVFVDVGANHFKSASKTYYLESRLGWSGIAVEPQREFADEYVKFRPKTKFLPFFVSDESNHTAKLYLLQSKHQIASSDAAFVKQFGRPAEVRDVPTATLNDLLDAQGIRTFDFLSMDIELHEPQALAGFDIERFRPALVCIEGLLPVRQRILDYFAAHGYVLVGRYMWVDLENMYFAPLGTAGERPPAPVPGAPAPR
jgi:FkbM family methyltransferase